jgi:ferredoxin-NADP reductase
MLEAVVVALVFVLPYFVPLHLGTLGPSPQLALLVGNLLVLALARPVAARMRFAGRRPLTSTSTEFSFRPERPVRHRAGQYLELQLAHRDADRRGIRRTLTIVSPPDDPSGEVRVAVRTTDPRSSFKRALDVLPLGSPVRAATVSGAFTLPKDRTVPLLLVASGIGITPFVSQLLEERRLVDAGAPPRDVVLVDRVPSPDDIPYSDVLEASGVRVLLVTPEPETLQGVGLPDQWHLTDRFDAAALREVLPEPRRRLAYVSGSPRFVARAKRVLRAAGVRRIRTDAFAGY